MTVLSAIQGACAVIGIDIPSAVYGSPDREFVELGALANEMGARIAKDADWTILRKKHSFTGDGVTESFAFPADYDRMLKDANVWSDRVETPFRHVISNDEWLELDIRSYEVFIGAWTRYGGLMHIKPIMASTETASYFYISKNFATDAGGTGIAEFMTDSDVFLIDERLLKLGIIWQWRANKGLPYAEDMANYERLRDRLASDDAGARVVRVGRGRLAYGGRFAYPQSIIVP